jgi:cytoskeleton protein RodZ
VGSMRAADVFGPSRPIKIRERRSPSLAMIVVIALLAIIGFAAYRLVSSHDHSGKPAATASTPPARPSAHPTAAAKPSVTASPTLSDVVINVAAGQEPCWVLLTSASDGSQIYMGDVLAGTSMTWTEKEAVNIRLGNPAAVTLTVDGQRHPINTVLPVTLNFSPPGSASGSASASPSS